MNNRVGRFPIAVNFTLVVLLLTNSVAVIAQEAGKKDPKAVQEQSRATGPIDAAKALEILQHDVGNWNASITFWFRPGSAPVVSQASVTANMAVGGKYLEQRFEGTFGPELGDRKWSSVSFTGFDANSGNFEATRLSSTGAPIIVVRGKGFTDDEKGKVIELSGEYTMMGSKATSRDVIRHEGPDKCIIESWMSFGGSPEYKGAEMILTRHQKAPSSQGNR